MTTITKSVRTILLAESDVTDIIGQRIYVLSFPANPTFPLMVYRDISGAHALRSAPKDSTVEMSTRLQFDIWAETYDETQDMKEVLVALFDGYKSATYGILTTKVDLNFSLRDPDTDLYRHAIDISIVHEGA